MNPHNARLVAFLREKEREMQAYGDMGRCRALAGAVRSINNYPHPITSTQEARLLKGIGEYTAGVIEEGLIELRRLRNDEEDGDTDVASSHDTSPATSPPTSPIISSSAPIPSSTSSSSSSSQQTAKSRQTSTTTASTATSLSKPVTTPTAISSQPPAPMLHHSLSLGNFPTLPFPLPIPIPNPAASPSTATAIPNATPFSFFSANPALFPFPTTAAIPNTASNARAVPSPSAASSAYDVASSSNGQTNSEDLLIVAEKRARNSSRSPSKPAPTVDLTASEDDGIISISTLGSPVGQKRVRQTAAQSRSPTRSRSQQQPTQPAAVDPAALQQVYAQAANAFVANLLLSLPQYAAVAAQAQAVQNLAAGQSNQPSIQITPTPSAQPTNVTAAAANPTLGASAALSRGSLRVAPAVSAQDSVSGVQGSASPATSPRRVVEIGSSSAKSSTPTSVSTPASSPAPTSASTSTASSTSKQTKKKRAGSKPQPKSASPAKPKARTGARSKSAASSPSKSSEGEVAKPFVQIRGTQLRQEFLLHQKPNDNDFVEPPRRFYLPQFLRYCVHPQRYKDGWDYYQKGHVVSLTQITPGLYAASVAGIQVYDVQIRIDSEQINTVYCSCPFMVRQLQGWCKHLVAVLLRILWGPPPPQAVFKQLPRPTFSHSLAPRVLLPNFENDSEPGASDEQLQDSQATTPKKRRTRKKQSTTATQDPNDTPVARAARAAMARMEASSSSSQASQSQSESGSSSQSSSTMTIDVHDDESEEAPSTSTPKRGRKPRKYIPRERTGAYAILIALYRGRKDGPMTKDQIVPLARPFATHSFETEPGQVGKPRGGWFTAWDGIKKLRSENLVTVEDMDVPERRWAYLLSREGKELAKLLSANEERRQQQQQGLDLPVLPGGITTSTPTTASTSTSTTSNTSAATTSASTATPTATSPSRASQANSGATAVTESPVRQLSIGSDDEDDRVDLNVVAEKFIPQWAQPSKKQRDKIASRGLSPNRKSHSAPHFARPVLPPDLRSPASEISRPRFPIAALGLDIDKDSDDDEADGSSLSSLLPSGLLSTTGSIAPIVEDVALAAALEMSQQTFMEESQRLDLEEQSQLEEALQLSLGTSQANDESEASFRFEDAVRSPPQLGTETQNPTGGSKNKNKRKSLDSSSGDATTNATTTTPKQRKVYKCQKCGLPKRGHICKGEPQSSADESSQSQPMSPPKPQPQSQPKPKPAAQLQPHAQQASPPSPSTVQPAPSRSLPTTVSVSSAAPVSFVPLHAPTMITRPSVPEPSTSPQPLSVPTAALSPMPSLVPSSTTPLTSSSTAPTFSSNPLVSSNLTGILAPMPPLLSIPTTLVPIAMSPSSTTNDSAIHPLSTSTSTPPSTSTSTSTSTSSTTNAYTYHQQPEQKKATTPVPQYLSGEEVTSDYDIVLLADARESKASMAMLEADFSTRGLKCDSRGLTLGDFMWVARKKKATATARQNSMTDTATGSSQTDADESESQTDIPSPSSQPKPRRRRRSAGTTTTTTATTETSHRKKKYTEDPADELVLDWIVERKTVVDLMATIEDGRLDQLVRLAKSDLNVVFLVEGLNSGQSMLPEYLFQDLIHSINANYHFVIKITRSAEETRRYLTQMTTLLTRKYQTIGIRNQVASSSTSTSDRSDSQDEETMLDTQHSSTQDSMTQMPCDASTSHSPSTSASTSTATTTTTIAGQPEKRIRTYDEFSREMQKGRMPIKQVFVRMLSRLEKCQLEKAQAIADIYGTPMQLVQAYDQLTRSRRDGLLANVRWEGRKKIGPILSRKISHLFNDKEYDDAGEALSQVT